MRPVTAKFLVLFLVFASAVPNVNVARAQKVVPQSREQITFSFAPVVKRVTPAVVNVYVRQRVRAQSPMFDDPFFEKFFNRQLGKQGERVQNSLGSGVIVDPSGIVVTNNHVIQGGGETEIKVALSDGKEFDAKILLKDERTDLAILQIGTAGAKFPFLALADADLLEVGDMVLAIGNPFGVGQTVTSGIVSALARTVAGISDYQFFIQTDAAINPGNSGGALVDMDGRLVGVNTAIYSRSGGSQGIGFAIPANMVKVVIESARQGSSVRRPWFGASLEEVTVQSASSAGLEGPSGVLVGSVTDGSPAASGGIKSGDIITAVDGTPVADPSTFQYRFATKGTTGQTSIEIIRSKQRQTLFVPLMKAPETPSRDVREISGRNPLSGARVANLSPAVAEELSIAETKGVVILEIDPNSIARRIGVKAGDVIADINGDKVESSARLERQLNRRVGKWDLTVKRGEQLLTVSILG